MWLMCSTDQENGYGFLKNIPGNVFIACLQFFSYFRVLLIRIGVIIINKIEFIIIYILFQRNTVYKSITSFISANSDLMDTFFRITVDNTFIFD